jgi:hypothetical protein
MTHSSDCHNQEMAFSSVSVQLFLSTNRLTSCTPAKPNLYFDSSLILSLVNLCTELHVHIP